MIITSSQEWSESMTMKAEVLNVRQHLIETSDDVQEFLVNCDGVVEHALNTAIEAIAPCTAIALFDTGANININIIPEEDKEMIVELAHQAMQNINPRFPEMPIHDAFNYWFDEYRIKYLKHFNEAIQDLLEESEQA